MIRPRMRRPLRSIVLSLAAVGVALGASACGTEQIAAVPRNDANYTADHQAALLFDQRCAGCHTLSYAGTHGSGANPRTYEAINGPNFNVRCERPATRVLYAIENGGFSGAYMPPNILVGQQAREVAMFVSRYAGRQAPFQPGVVSCATQQVGTLPAPPPPGPLTQSTGASNPSAGNPALTKTTPTAKTKKTGGTRRTNQKSKAKGY
jgi:mono/diheme cytochrome c family protein